jgi:hypothetical protein
VDLFVSREPSTFDSLHELGFPDAKNQLSADLAFLIDTSAQPAGSSAPGQPPSQPAAPQPPPVKALPLRPYRLAFVRSNNMPLAELTFATTMPGQAENQHCLLHSGKPVVPCGSVPIVFASSDESVDEAFFAQVAQKMPQVGPESARFMHWFAQWIRCVVCLGLCLLV